MVFPNAGKTDVRADYCVCSPARSRLQGWLKKHKRTKKMFLFLLGFSRL